MIVDTDVLVWFYRGLESAKELVFSHVPFSISIVTYLELLQGVRDKNEMRKLKKDMTLWATMILPVNEKISERAVALEESYALSHGLELADAFIAATAIEYQKPLITGNIRHYAYMPDIQTVPFYL